MMRCTHCAAILQFYTGGDGKELVSQQVRCGACFQVMCIVGLRGELPPPPTDKASSFTARHEHALARGGAILTDHEHAA
eukprot:4490593-Prymnesium_polylepis.1